MSTLNVTNIKAADGTSGLSIANSTGLVTAIAGFSNLKADDWSMEVAPFWDIVIDSALNLEAIAGLLHSGWQTVEGALSLGLMSRGYERGVIRFGLISGQK